MYTKGPESQISVCLTMGSLIFKVQVIIGPVMNHPEITVRGISHLLVHVCITTKFSLHFALGPDILEIELSFPKYEIHFMTSQ